MDKLAWQEPSAPPRTTLLPTAWPLHVIPLPLPKKAPCHHSRPSLLLWLSAITAPSYRSSLPLNGNTILKIQPTRQFRGHTSTHLMYRQCASFTVAVAGAYTCACVRVREIMLFIGKPKGRSMMISVCTCLCVHVGTYTSICISLIAHLSASQASLRLSDESEPAHFSLSA